MLIQFHNPVDRVKWFRDRSARDRAREEKEILEEEFKRTIRHFQYMQTTWSVLATKKMDAPPGYVAYAYKQAAMYERFALDAQKLQTKAEEKLQIYDNW